MVSITLSVPEDVRKLMKEFPEVNWSALVRKVIIEKAKQLEMKEIILKDLEKEKGEIDWSVKLARKVKREMARRHNLVEE